MSRERTTPTRPWRGTSADERRAGRRERFIEAALEVIGTHGAASATVRAVCKQAGLTDRYFYEAFGSQETLLLDVFEHVRDEVVAAVLDAFANAPPDPRSKAHASITAAFTLLTDDPRKGRVLLLEAISDERLAQRRQQTLLANAELLAGIAEQYFGAHPGDATDTKLTALAIVGAETELAAAYLAGNLDVPLGRLIDHLTELHLAVAAISSAPQQQTGRN